MEREASRANEDFESALEQRDARIAELEQKIEAFKTNFATRLDIAARKLAAADIGLARAEVPEWCRQFVQKVRDSFMVCEYVGYRIDKEGIRIDKEGIADACHMLTETRLRACGIEP